MLFSIIVPVYNAEHTLPKCINSLLEQSIKDYEVILIDDGSNDSSSVLCNKYSRLYPFIKVIHQKNRGPSAARNAGIRLSAGDYICFVDSDDTVSTYYLDRIYSEIQKSGADIIFFGYRLYGFDSQLQQEQSYEFKGSGLPLLLELSEKNMFGYTWCKCIKRDLVKNTFFPEKINLFEDELFTIDAVSKAREITYIKEPIYNYYIGENTLSEKTHQDYCGLSDQVYCEWVRLLKDSGIGQVFLQKKAERFVDRCKYYGYEHNVDCRAFFMDLKKTAFFNDHPKIDAFDRWMIEERWNRITLERMFYRIKWKIRQEINRVKFR